MAESGDFGQEFMAGKHINTQHAAKVIFDR
jgi:hypothetical protein